MKLIVLGSNGYCPTDLGQTACYAIPELGITLDAGTGMYRMADYLQNVKLDIYLTHSHRDHTWGLSYIEHVFLKKLLREAITQNPKPKMSSIFKSLGESPPRIRIHLAAEHLENVQSQVRNKKIYKYMEFVSLLGTEELSDNTTITPFTVGQQKNERVYGFRLDYPGGSLAYVTDTYGEPGAIYQENIRGVNVLLHDCYCPDSDSELARAVVHSHITPVAQLAAEAQVGRLVLVHLPSSRPEYGEPELDLAHPIFPRTEVAFDRMEIEF